MKYELNKIFAKGLNRSLLMIMIVVAVVFSIFAIGSMNYVDKDGKIHSGIEAARSLTEEKNNWRGSLTPQVLSDIVLKVQTDRQQTSYMGNDPQLVPMQPYFDIEFMINTILSGDGEYNSDAIMQITPQQAKKLYHIREKNIFEMVQKKALSKQDYLKKEYLKTNTPFYYEAADSWKTMFMYVKIYGLVIVALIGFLAAGIFADEFQLKAEVIFFSCRNGRGKGVLDKLGTGILMATVVYWSGMIVLSVISFGVMGISGAKTPIQVEDVYNIYALTYGQFYLIILLCGYIASLLSASISMLIAAASHSATLATGGSLLLFCALPFIGLATQFKTFFALTPDQLANVNVCIEMSLIYEIGGVIFRQVPFIMALYTFVSFILLPIAYGSYRRYIMK